MADNLRVAMIASNVLRIPPTNEFVPTGWSGAPEWNVYEVTEGLVKKGIDVTLFASGNSKTSAKLESVNPLDSYTDPLIGLGKHVGHELALVSHAYELAKKGRFDIIHSQVPRSGLFSKLVEIPTVATLHSPLDTDIGGILKYMKNSQHYVSISDSQREPVPDLNFVATVYHGFDVKGIPWSEKKEGYLVYAGRIVPEKGVDIAIKIAKKAGKKLVIVGSPVSEEDSFWKEKIEPSIDSGDVVYEGFKERNKVFEYLKNAEAYLMPLRIREPFGMAMAEAMATGTPVIAYSRGSVPEIVKDGETGFVIQETGDKEKDLEAMVKAVHNIGSISPLACRKHVEDNFSIEREVDGYISVYEELTNSN